MFVNQQICYDREWQGHPSGWYQLSKGRSHRDTMKSFADIQNPILLGGELKPINYRLDRGCSNGLILINSH